MLSRARYLVSDVAYWLRTDPVRGAVGLLVVLAAIAAAAFGISELASDDDTRSLAPAPEVVVRAEEPPEEPSELGFPAFATSNTTRVAGADPIADAAGVALAAFPSTGGVDGPDAVTLVPADDWASGIAAAALVADPIGAPIVLTDGEEIPALTSEALATLAPAGSAATADRQAFVIGAAPEPDSLTTTRVDGTTPAEVAGEIARLRERLTEAKPAHLLIATADEAAYAMPAAAWAARSGDPVLFTERDSVPAATLDAIERYQDVPVYLLGGDDVISKKAEKEIAKATKASVRRAAAEPTAVENAIEFARYVDGTFGWDINDPGHGFVIANSARPGDAAAAAPLSGSGTWGPMLITDAADSLPPELGEYLLDVKPGYDEDPTRAVYNHIWIVGDESAISVGFQAEIDEIAEVAPIRSGSGESFLGPAPGTPEPEAPDRNQDR